MLKLSLFRYFSLSTCLASFALYYAYLENEQFYPTVIYLTTNKLCVLSLGNFGLSLVLLIMSVLVRMIFVRIEDDEQNEILQNTKFTIVEMCIALTSFRSDILSVGCVSLFVALLLSKVMHWLSKLRMENLARNVPMIVSKTRLILGLFVLLFIDLVFGSMLCYLTITDGFSVYVLFAFEFLILGLATFQQICRFRVVTYDQAMHNRWEAKPTVMFVIEAIHDVIHLGLYVAFAVYVTQHWNFPLYLLREIYLAVQQLQRRLHAYFAYRAIIRVLDTQFPTLTADEIRESGRDLRCVICFEDMELGKELPCRHCFHLACLKGWFVQKQECPLCRKKVVATVHSALAARHRQEQLRRQREVNLNQQNPPGAAAAAAAAAGGAIPPVNPAVPAAPQNPLSSTVTADNTSVTVTSAMLNSKEEEEKKDDRSGVAPSLNQPTLLQHPQPPPLPPLSFPPTGVSGWPSATPMSAAMPLPSMMMRPDLQQCRSVADVRREVERQTIVSQMRMEYHRMCLNNAQFEFDSLVQLQLRFNQIVNVEIDNDDGNNPAAQADVAAAAAPQKPVTPKRNPIDSGTLRSAANSSPSEGLALSGSVSDKPGMSPQRLQMLEKRLQSFSHLERPKSKTEEPTPEGAN